MNLGTIVSEYETSWETKCMYIYSLRHFLGEDDQNA